ncbi:MAG: copper resistance protein CopC, partial [Nocardioidaceae bacterium]
MAEVRACEPRNHHRPWALRATLILLALLAATLLAAAPASAHAVLVSSDPPAGAKLAATPGTVTLVYDEPLEPALSTASVTSPTGQTSNATVSGKTMKVRLRGNARGLYQVDWKTVSEVDGHTITGHFEFGVGVAAAAGSNVPQINGFDIALAVPRGIEYALLLLAFGVALLPRLAPRIEVRLPVRSLAAALLVAGVVVVVAEGVVAGDVLTYLGNGVPGWSRVARLVGEAGLLVVAVLTRRLSFAILTGIAVLVAFAGHGADVEPSWQGITVNAAHLVSAGVWAGGIMALAVVRLTGQWDRSGRRLLPHFTRVAPWAFGASVILGAFQAYQLLGSPDPLIRTDYGITLLVKAGAIALMVPLSVLAWRRLRISVRVEAVLALVAVAAAAALAAYPVIPKEAREARAEAAGTTGTARSAHAPWAPAAGQLTMGGRAGAVMAAMTLDPGRPGRNTIKVYLASPANRHSNATAHV